jgi:RNA recognition motif-containing protein
VPLLLPQVVRDKRTNKSKGYGFVSFLDGNDFAKAMREMNGKYIGNRPCKLRKSSWEERTPQQAGGKRKAPGGGAGPKHKNHIAIAPRLAQQWEKQ